MDKRKLKNYLAESRSAELMTSCYLIDDKYIISNSYSMIALNDSNDLDVKTKDAVNNLERIEVFYRDFTEKTSFLKEFAPVFTEEMYKIDDNYCVSLKNLKKIKNLIKANKFEILNYDAYHKYIIKASNTKTKEIAYLLPCRVH